MVVYLYFVKLHRFIINSALEPFFKAFFTHALHSRLEALLYTQMLFSPL